MSTKPDPNAPAKRPTRRKPAPFAGMFGDRASGDPVARQTPDRDMDWSRLFAPPRQR